MQCTTFEVNADYIFCHGQIGTSDFFEYISSLPKINLVYAALPKVEFFSFWYSLTDVSPISHPQFIAGLSNLFKLLDADEYHLEGNTSNKQDVHAIFDSDVYPFYYEQPILYSAPMSSQSNGFARRRHSDLLMIFSKHPLNPPKATYSHEYLDLLLQTKSNITCFDPVIGKGLLARFALQYHLPCYGIEMNINRLKHTITYIREHLE